MTSLPEPSFLDRDPEVIRNDIVARVEEILGATLPPISTERSMCELLAYRETLVRISVQEACLQNLWAYARYPMIDHLALLVGGTRLAAKAAVATFTATLPAARGVPSVVSATTQIRSKDGKVIFTVDADIVIAAGSLTGTSAGTCTTTGPAGNGYLPGTVTELVSPLDFEVGVSNTTETSGGAVSESTEAMRERLPTTLSTMSGAGPSDAYETLARGASADVIDAKATRPSDGVVRVTIIGADGVPSVGLLEQVAAVFNPETNVPQNDTVEVVGGVPVAIDLALTVTLYRPQSPRTTQDVLDDAETVASAYVSSRGLKLGYQVPKGRVVDKAISVTEVYDAAVTSAIPVIGAGEFAVLNTCTVTLAGYTEEPLP